MAEYSRPASAFRFKGGRMRTNSPADALPEDCYPYLQNTRNSQDSCLTSRPQMVSSQAAPAGGSAVLALEPTIGVYKEGSSIYVAGTVIDTGYASGLGCSIIPFRPNASPNPWAYVFDDNKSSKVYVPSSGSPTVYKAGIAEPQSAPEACPDHFAFLQPSSAAVDWAIGGTAGATANGTRLTDTALAFFADPASVSPAVATRYSLQVSDSKQYHTGQIIRITRASGGDSPVVVQDVFPQINLQSVTILSIMYFSGATGRCIIVPSQSPINPSIPQFTETAVSSDSINAQEFLSTLRRGSLVRINAAETVLVLSVSTGPNGLISFETTTTATHSAGEAIVGIPAVAITTNIATSDLVGQAISGAQISSTIAAGIGTLTKTLSASQNPFANTPFLSGNYQPTAQTDDYVHISVLVPDPTNVTEFKILFDIGDGSFTQNYCYYAVRPSDLTSAVANTQTQLAASQVITQRSLITGEIRDLRDLAFSPFTPDINIDLTGDQGTGLVPPSDKSSPGVSQWTEVMFPVSALTRVGSDETKSLTVTNAVQLLFNVGAGEAILFDSFWVGTGGQPDVGEVGMPYFYRAVPRNTTTGAKGNPSPATRYGVSPRRQKVIVSPPSSSYDSQIDIWDIFRFGGAVNAYRYIGSCAAGAKFTDNFPDTVAIAGSVLDLSNFEPFPSIGPPISASSATVVGTLMQATFATSSAQPSAQGTLSQLGSLLPGNQFIIVDQVFTLYKRPTLVSSTATTQTYLFEFQESAGYVQTGAAVLNEPNLAAQGAKCVFGPDARGRFFAVQAGAVNNGGLGLRAGLVQWTNANNPDGASDGNTYDLCAPSEPLMGGAVLGPTPVVFSTKRAWRGFPQDSGRYAWAEIPVGAGLAAQFGICTDGKQIYYVAKDGIQTTAGGSSQSLTQEDLYNLFPREGIFPQDVTYAGATVKAPEYKFASNIRLAVINQYLYFDYLDSAQAYRTLVCDLRKTAWSVDVYQNPASIHAGSSAPASNQLIPAFAIRNNQLFMGDNTGAIFTEQSSPVSSIGESVACLVFTREEMFGDIRANKIIGDASVDCLASGGDITITPVFFGSLFGTTTTITGGQTARAASPSTVNLLGLQIKRSLGLKFSWTDQGVNTLLVSWQPEYITQPPDITNRFTDWDNCGTPDNKYIQGFEIETDSVNVLKTLKVKDSDTLAFHDFTSSAGTNQVQANGQQVIACSFNTPFRAHLVRLEPQDFTIWRLFGIKWIFEPTPESVLTWTAQGTSFGLNGYIHAKEILLAYSATATVTFTVSCYDGNSPAVVTLPSTGGDYRKTRIPFSANKGLLYFLSATSTAPFQIYANDCEIVIREWGSAGPYQTVRNIGGIRGDAARI